MYPDALDLARVVLARAASRLAIDEAEARYAEAAGSAYRVEIGTCVSRVSGFVTALLAHEGLSLDEICWLLVPPSGWPFSPAIPRGGSGPPPQRRLQAKGPRYVPGGATGGHPGLSMGIRGGGRMRVHVRGHCIELVGRAGAVWFSTEMGELRVQVPGSLPPSLRRAVVGRRADLVVALAAVEGRDWIVRDLLPPATGRSWTFVIPTGTEPFDMPWTRA